MRSLIPLLLLSLLVACTGTKTIDFIAPNGEDRVPLTVEIADSPTERSNGLMGRTTMEEDHGMLFVFMEAAPLQFWMKDTLIPLEILYFDASGSFVNVAEMEPCTADPCPTYPSAAAAQYAVEVNPGFREQQGIGVGWKIDLEQVDKLSNPK